MTMEDRVEKLCAIYGQDEISPLIGYFPDSNDATLLLFCLQHKMDPNSTTHAFFWRIGTYLILITPECPKMWIWVMFTI